MRSRVVIVIVGLIVVSIVAGVSYWIIQTRKTERAVTGRPVVSEEESAVPTEAGAGAGERAAPPVGEDERVANYSDDIIVYPPGSTSDPKTLKQIREEQALASQTPTGAEPSVLVIPQVPTDGVAPSPIGGAIDPDEDGLTNDQEMNAGTDPNNADTDGDGLTDGEELQAYRTDPKNFDTDGDDLTDGEEVNTWKTNPNIADTDGDGYADGVEVQGGYNPLGPGRL